MDELIERLEQLTESFANRLDEIDYEDIVDFVEQREALIARVMTMSIPPGEQAQMKERVVRLLESDRIIAQKAQQFKNEAESGMKRFSAANTSRKAYENNGYAESVFFDRKK